MQRVRWLALLLCVALCACSAAQAMPDGTMDAAAAGQAGLHELHAAADGEGGEPLPPADAARPLPAPTTFRYGRGFLAGDALALYDLLRDAADRLDLAAALPVPASLGAAELDRVLSYLLDDNPRFYWADFRLGVDAEGGRTVGLVSALDAAALAQREAELLAAADRLLEGIAGGEAEIVYEIHDRLVATLRYEREGAHPDVGNLYGGLVRGSVICDGFAQTYHFLLDRAGVEAIILRGSSHRGVSHAWNAVRVDGQWYYADLTWDKAASPDSPAGAISRQYLCITYDEMVAQHQWLDTQYPELPAADAVDASFFVRAGCAVAGANPSSRAALSEAFAARLAGAVAASAEPVDGEIYLEVKLLGSQEDYRQLKHLFIKSLYEILGDLAAEAADSGRPYTVRTGGEIRCDYNDAVQVLILYPHIAV